MKTTRLITLAWRNIWRNPWRSSAVIAAMSLGLLGVLIISAFSNGMTQSMISNAIDSELGHIQVHTPQYLLQSSFANHIGPSEQGQLIELLNSSQMPQLSYSPRISIPAMMATASRSVGIKLQGIEPDLEAATTTIKDLIIAGDWLSAQQKRPIVISQRNANRLKAKLKSKLVLTYSDIDAQVAGSAFRVVGIYQSGSSVFDDNHVFVLKTDIAPSTVPSLSHELVIRLFDESLSSNIQQQLQQLFSDKLAIQRWDESQPMLATMIQASKFSNFIILGVFVAAMGFGIINVILMIVFERTREFGVLLAVGMQSRQIVFLVLVESLFLAALATVIAGVTGVWLLFYFANYGLDLSAMSQGLNAFGSSSLIYPKLSLLEFVYSSASVLIVAVIAALIPARRLFKLAPHQAMAEKH